MASITVLPPHVADLIAAGEVVERPASVIKELMENAIDAGATALTVEIRSGGMTYLRVTDNGCGIPAGEAETAFLRHATSKLQDARGLEAIGTLGFRGEALAAISAVSRIDLLTRVRGAEEGLSLSLEAGHTVSRSPAGCPEGTTMIVRDLFFNTPARLKFMKSDRAEGQAVSAAVLRCALSHPELSVRYIKDGAEESHTPGDGRADSAVYALLGRDFAKSLLPVKTDKLSGFIAAPAAARGNRGFQFFFVNGRFVKSATLQAALEQAFRNNIPQGRFPAAVLYLTLPASAVDVNVHPAKTEVKFLQEREVFDSVYYGVLAALSDAAPPRELHLEQRTEKTPVPAPAPRADAFRRVPAAEYRAELKKAETAKSRIPVFPEWEQGSTLREKPVIPYQTRLSQVTEAARTVQAEKAPEPVPAARAAAPVQRPERSAETLQLAESPVEKEVLPVRVVGEALQTYIVAEQGESLLLIDKHAAHERIIFDRLQAGEGEIMSEFLLTPVPVHLGEKAAVVQENRALLEQLGFAVEEFGGDAVLVRAVPAECFPKDVAPMLEELAEKLSAARAPGQLGLRDEILHSVACKAAIKAGSESSRQELEALALRVASGEIKYCPHGRPVAVTLTKKELDKAFKRL